MDNVLILLLESRERTVTHYRIIISHESFNFFGINTSLRRVCIPRKYKCLVRYSTVYHPEATDSARLTAGNSRITEERCSKKPDFPRGYRRLPKMFYLPNKSDFRRWSALHGSIRFSEKKSGFRIDSWSLDSRLAETGRISEDVRHCSIFAGGYRRSFICRLSQILKQLSFLGV